jgi:hypothetical protein
MLSYFQPWKRLFDRKCTIVSAMAPTLKTFWLLWVLGGLFRATVGAPAKRLATSQPPNEDDFYRPPQGYEKAAPGTILRHRPTPLPITLDNKAGINIKAAWQLLYRTQDSTGKPEATVTTILVPHNAKRGNLFSYSWFSVSSQPTELDGC